MSSRACGRSTAPCGRRRLCSRRGRPPAARPPTSAAPGGRRSLPPLPRADAAEPARSGDGGGVETHAPAARRARPRPARWLSIEELAAPRHELVASRPRADELDRRADQLADALDVVPAARGQVVPAARRAYVGLPHRALFVNRLAVLVMRDVRDRVVEAGAAKLITRAQLQQRLVVEDVEPHQGGDADAVEAHGVAADRGVEPADAPRPAGDGPELVAAFTDLVPHLVEQLGRKRPVPDARGIRLEHTER